jgi:acetyl esterase/lipase
MNRTLTLVVLSAAIALPLSAQSFTFSQQQYHVSEGAGSVTVTIVRTSDTSVTDTVQYQTQRSSAGEQLATPGADYTATAGTLTFAPGETQKSVAVPIVQDAISEPTEVFPLAITWQTPFGLHGNSVQIFIDDDDPIVNFGFSSGTYTARESDGYAEVVLQRDNAYDAVTATITSPGGPDIPVSLAPGEMSKTVRIPIVDDGVFRGSPRTLLLSLHDLAGARYANAGTIVTILEGEPRPVVSVRDMTVVEGDSGTKNAVVTFTMSGAVYIAFCMQYVIHDGTAHAGVDYIPPPYFADTKLYGVCFDAGRTTATATFQIIGNTTPQQDRQFVIEPLPDLSEPFEPLPGHAGVITIADDDRTGFSISDARVTEGNGNDTVAQVNVKLTGSFSAPVSVDYATVSGTATAGSDFTPVAGTLVFAPGETQKKIDIPIVGDTVPEDDEVFTVHLSNAVGASILDATAAVTIANDDEVATEYASLQYGEAGGQPLLLDLYVPNGGAAPYPLVVWIHGDHWNDGSRTDAMPASHELSRGYAIASIDYRLSTAAPFPAQLNDAQAALRWLRDNAARYGLDASRIAAWGFGSGAQLAALLGTSQSVQAVVDYAGPVDLTRLASDALACSTADFHYVTQLLGCDPQRCPDAAAAADPARFATRGDAPFLIVHGEEDCDVSPAQSRDFAAALTAAGVSARLVIVPGQSHNGAFWESPEVLKEVERFLDGAFHPAAPARRRPSH